MIVQKCNARRHPHLGACVLVDREVPDPKPKADKPDQRSPVLVQGRAPTGWELQDAKRAPVSTVEGIQAASGEEARDLLARAVADIALQRPSLRRLRRLLRSEDDKVAGGTWEQVMTFLKAAKSDGASGKPIQIQLNNFVPRPG